MSAPTRILVVGSGGIGGNVAAGLLQHEPGLAAVVTLSTNAAIAEAVNEHGFRVTDGGSTRAIRGEVVASLPDDGEPFDWILLATQPPQVEEAARAVVDRLAPTGAMVCFQNGLCEARIAAIAGPQRVIGAIVAWGASMHEPGVYEKTSSGGFTIGRTDGADDPRLQQLALLLEIVGPVTITSNLAGARWSKLAINSAISTLGTIGGDRLGPLMRHQFARRLALEVITEAVTVARAEGIALEKVSGTIDLDWITLTEAERRQTGSVSLVAKHSLCLAVGARYRNMRSSMLSAIERGRPPAVDFLNGEIVARGERHGIPTPVNAAATAFVHHLASGERVPSVETLRALFEATAHVRP